MSAAAAAANPLLLQNRPIAGEVIPEKFPSTFQIPPPSPLTQADRELVERSRFLSETFKYSGYYVVPDPSKPVTQLLVAHGFSQTNQATNEKPNTQQVYTQTFERYSDRYRKILGKKTFHNEISPPNVHLFPPELISDKHGRLVRPTNTTTFTSKVQFLSTKTLLSEVTRLVTARAPNTGSGERGSGAGANADDIGLDINMDGGDDMTDERKGDGEDEDGENMEMEEEEEDELDGGDDYLENHGDDDEDGGGDGFGEDDGEVF